MKVKVNGKTYKYDNARIISLKMIFQACRVPFILLGVFIIAFQFCRPIQVSGESMNTTLRDKQLIWGTKWNLSDIQRNDIIVAKAKLTKDDRVETVVKRVIGMPEEVIEIKKNVLYVNGKELKEDYLSEKMDTPDMKVTLGKEEYFCLGDNRNHSTDSRYFGAISMSHIQYKIFKY